MDRSLFSFNAPNPERDQGKVRAISDALFKAAEAIEPHLPKGQVAAFTDELVRINHLACSAACGGGEVVAFVQAPRPARPPAAESAGDIARAAQRRLRQETEARAEDRKRVGSRPEVKAAAEGLKAEAKRATEAQKSKKKAAKKRRTR